MIKIQENIYLKDFTTFRLGGLARYFVIVKNEEELREILIWIKSRKLPFFILGGGSNLLVADHNYSGVIIKNEIKGIKFIDQDIKSVYREMLELGIAKECARNVLPEYTTTRVHMSGTIRSFIHYVGLRGKENTQLEHRNIAHSIGRILKKELPIVYKAIKTVDDPSLAGWNFGKPT